MLRRVLLPLLLAALPGGCGLDSETLVLHVRAYQSDHKDAISEVFETRSGVRLAVVPAEAGESGIEALLGSRANLALVNNSTPFVNGVRAVLPLYESVLHVLVREGLTVTDAGLSLAGHSVYLPNGSSAGRTVVELMAQRQGLESGDYEITSVFDAASTDIIVHFGPIDPANVSWYRPGFTLVNLSNAGSDAVTYVLPRMSPATIPAQTYAVPGNEMPVQTVSVRTLLVAERDLPETAIYELTRTIIEQKPRLTSFAPSLFAAVSDDFDPLDLSFPLHEGARRYLERDEPNTLERYAETINMLAYVGALTLTGFVAAYRWRARRKRERIDGFYTRVLKLRKRADGDDRRALLAELDELEEEAFGLLVEDKLAADESFRIFTELVSRLRLELQAQRL